VLQNGFRIGEFHHVEPLLNTVAGPAGTTRLEPKVMQVLVCLAAQAGQVVPKERLMRTVWPDTAVGDDVLTRCISELRRLFGDDAREPRFIETIPKSGYRLIAGVAARTEQNPAAPRQDGVTVSIPAVAHAMRHRHALTVAGVVVLTGVAVGGWWITSSRREPAGPPVQPTLTQLTANPPGMPVTSAQISPDGKYLAYADPTGIQVRVIDSGETQRMADTRGMLVYGWSGDGTVIRAGACEAATCTGWELSLVGGTRRRSGVLWPVTDSVIATPDGSRLLRITRGSGDVWVDPLDGSPRRLITLGLYGSATWSADGERVLFARGLTPSAVESIPLAGGSPSLVFKAPEGHGITQTGLHLRDGRLLTLLSDANTDAVAVWEIPVDGRSGRARGSPRRLTEWRAGAAHPWKHPPPWELSSASADGTRVAMTGLMDHSDLYVARFDEHQGRLLETPRRLTIDQRGSFLTAWTSDGKAILFSMGQRGSQDIFKQSLQAESAEPLVVGPGHQVMARMSSDGQWVLFLEPTDADAVRHWRTRGWRIMRVPLAGGRPQQVFATDRFAFPRCSVRGRCVLFEQHQDRYVISSLDPVRGKGERLGSVPSTLRGEDLSPDGNLVAVLDAARPTNRIQIYSLQGELQKEIVVENAGVLQNLDWGGTGAGAGFFSTNHTAGRSELLFIRLDGTSRVLWSQQGTSGVPAAAIPSPDGTHLAIAGYIRHSNVWLLTGR
jgi:DNA-binding winged helix-turn-helix (wHTH) protein/Tol biopolymer transport system component